jgi:hypothetical protein
MTSLENGMALVKREVAYSDEADAQQQMSIDKLTARVERIERRLELQD